MEQMYNVSSNPHIRDKMTTSRIMQLVVIALLPTTLFGIWNFGVHALLVVLATVASSVFFEWLYDRLMHKKNTTTDFSAVVTGLLLALNMPPQIPIWMPILGSAFAIIVVKQLFGGLGQNFMNPALAGRCFLMISFAGKMTNFAVSKSSHAVVDAVTQATPLAALKNQGFIEGTSIPVKNLFLGNIQGTIGETSALAILIGAVILLAFKIIDLKVPLTYIGSFAVQLINGVKRIVILRSRSLVKVLVAITAGTVQPNPISIGTILRPESPILRSNLSMTKATLAI